MNSEPIWHGTPQEATELANALANNCACEFGALGVRLVICPAHAMVADQRILDGLVFAHFMVTRLIQEEFSLAPALPASTD
jgi:hypothetical protein